MSSFYIYVIRRTTRNKKKSIHITVIFSLFPCVRYLDGNLWSEKIYGHTRLFQTLLGLSLNHQRSLSSNCPIYCLSYITKHTFQAEIDKQMNRLLYLLTFSHLTGLEKQPLFYLIVIDSESETNALGPWLENVILFAYRL